MSTYQRCPQSVPDMAAEILCKYVEHKSLLTGRVKIDYVFAYADEDEHGMKRGDAIRHHGVKALGLCRRIGLKDRALGRGDAEIMLDGDWWQKASEAEQRALLDHELHHLEVRMNQFGQIAFDDLQRPKLNLRPHDFEFGWFAVIAQRHKEASQERKQAKTILDSAGQWLWPDLMKGTK